MTCLSLSTPCVKTGFLPTHGLTNTNESREVGGSPDTRPLARPLYQRFRNVLLLRACLTLSRRMLRLGDFVVDDVLELLRRLRAGDLAAVDEKGGSTGYAELGRLGHVLLNLRLIFGLLEACVELLCVEPKLRRGCLQVSGSKLRLIGEDRVVILPKLVLLARASRRIGRVHGVLMNSEREVHIDYTQLITVFRANFLDRVLGGAAERALEVAKFDHRDWGILGPERRMPSACDRDTRGLERNLDVLAGTKVGDHLLRLLAVFALLQRRYQTLLDLVERSRSEAGLVVVEKLPRVGLSHFLRANLALEVLVGREMRVRGRLLEQVIVDQRIERVFAQIIELRGADALQQLCVHFLLCDAMAADRRDDEIRAGRASAAAEPGSQGKNRRRNDNRGDARRSGSLHATAFVSIEIHPFLPFIAG